MKNIKFIPLFLIALTLIVSSCAIDNDPAVIPMGEAVTASLDKTGEIYAFDGDEISVGFVLSRTLAESTQFTYTLNGVEKSIDLIQGQQSVSLAIPNVVGESNSIVLTGAFALNNDAVLVGSTNTSVTFIGVPAVTPGSINVLLNLHDTSGALALFALSVFDGDGNWLNDEFGGTISVDFSIPLTTDIDNSSDILPNYYALDIFSQSLDNTSYTIYIVKPDSSVNILSGTNLSQDGFVDQDVVLVDISDDPSTTGDKIYTFTQN